MAPKTLSSISTDWFTQTLPDVMSYSCTPELQPWEKPLLTQRKVIRSDGRLGRIEGCWVNGKAVEPGDAALVTYLLGRRRQVRDRGDAVDVPTHWRWCSDSTCGANGNKKIGPGWSDSSRFDGSEVELIVDGVRCVQIDGRWVTQDGGPCPNDKEA